MTGPSPDAELDAALGLDKLPPAQVSERHVELALAALFPVARFEPADVHELEPAARNQVQRTAQAIADAELRAVARYITEHAVAGTLPPAAVDVGEQAAPVPDADLLTVLGPALVDTLACEGWDVRAEVVRRLVDVASKAAQ